MGLFGGSKSQTVNETNVETNTTTDIGDIGFTGAQGVELAAVTQAGAVELSNQNTSLLRDISTASNDSVRQGYSSAEEITRAGRDVATFSLSAQQNVAETSLLSQESTAKSVVSEQGFTTRSAIDTLSNTFNDLFTGITDFGKKTFETAGSVAQTATQSSRDVAESAQSGPAAQIIRQAPVIIGLAIGGFIILGLLKRK